MDMETDGYVCDREEKEMKVRYRGKVESAADWLTNQYYKNVCFHLEIDAENYFEAMLY